MSALPRPRAPSLPLQSSGPRQIWLAVARTPNAAPVTGLVMVLLELGEFIPPGFVPVRRAGTARPANLRHGAGAATASGAAGAGSGAAAGGGGGGASSTTEAYLCMSRAPGAPIVDVGLVFPDGAAVQPLAGVVKKALIDSGLMNEAAPGDAAPLVPPRGGFTGSAGNVEASLAQRNKLFNTIPLSSLPVGLGGQPKREDVPPGYAVLASSVLDFKADLAGGSARGPAYVCYAKDTCLLDALGDPASLARHPRGALLASTSLPHELVFGPPMPASAAAGSSNPPCWRLPDAASTAEALSHAAYAPPILPLWVARQRSARARAAAGLTSAASSRPASRAGADGNDDGDDGEEEDPAESVTGGAAHPAGDSGASGNAAAGGGAGGAMRAIGDKMRVGFGKLFGGKGGSKPADAAATAAAASSAASEGTTSDAEGAGDGQGGDVHLGSDAEGSSSSTATGDLPAGRPRTLSQTGPLRTVKSVRAPAAGSDTAGAPPRRGSVARSTKPPPSGGASTGRGAGSDAEDGASHPRSRRSSQSQPPPDGAAAGGSSSASSAGGRSRSASLSTPAPLPSARRRSGVAPSSAAAAAAQHPPSHDEGDLLGLGEAGAGGPSLAGVRVTQVASPGDDDSQASPPRQPDQQLVARASRRRSSRPEQPQQQQQQHLERIHTGLRDDDGDASDSETDGGHHGHAAHARRRHDVTAASPGDEPGEEDEAEGESQYPPAPAGASRRSLRFRSRLDSGVRLSQLPGGGEHDDGGDADEEEDDGEGGDTFDSGAEDDRFGDTDDSDGDDGDDDDGGLSDGGSTYEGDASDDDPAAAAAARRSRRASRRARGDTAGSVSEPGGTPAAGGDAGAAAGSRASTRKSTRLSRRAAGGGGEHGHHRRSVRRDGAHHGGGHHHHDDGHHGLHRLDTRLAMGPGGAGATADDVLLAADGGGLLPMPVPLPMPAGGSSGSGAGAADGGAAAASSLDSSVAGGAGGDAAAAAAAAEARNRHILMFRTMSWVYSPSATRLAVGSAALQACPLDGTVSEANCLLSFLQPSPASVAITPLLRALYTRNADLAGAALSALARVVEAGFFMGPSSLLAGGAGGAKPPHASAPSTGTATPGGGVPSTGSRPRLASALGDDDSDDGYVPPLTPEQEHAFVAAGGWALLDVVTAVVCDACNPIADQVHGPLTAFLGAVLARAGAAPPPAHGSGSGGSGVMTTSSGITVVRAPQPGAAARAAAAARLPPPLPYGLHPSTLARVLSTCLGLHALAQQKRVYAGRGYRYCASRPGMARDARDFLRRLQTAEAHCRAHLEALKRIVSGLLAALELDAASPPDVSLSSLAVAAAAAVAARSGGAQLPPHAHAAPPLLVRATSFRADGSSGITPRSLFGDYGGLSRVYTSHVSGSPSFAADIHAAGQRHVLSRPHPHLPPALAVHFDAFSLWRRSATADALVLIATLAKLACEPISVAPEPGHAGGAHGGGGGGGGAGDRKSVV